MLEHQKEARVDERGKIWKLRVTGSKDRREQKGHVDRGMQKEKSKEKPKGYVLDGWSIGRRPGIKKGRCEGMGESLERAKGTEGTCE